MPVFSGCVYSRPPQRYAPQGLEDLSAHALGNMKLIGLPIKESHENGKVLGKIVSIII